MLCPSCERTLEAAPRLAWPDPVPSGMVEPWAATAYDEAPRALLLGHKERGLLALREPLASLLAVAVLAGPALAGAPRGPVVLTPVPSRRGTARRRGHDPTARITSAAARRLRRGGLDVVAAPLLRSRPGVVDQAGLGATERAANLAGSMHCPPELLRRLAARRPCARVVVCDDVITTGATLREAQRALEAVGLEVAAGAAVAATRRRFPAPPGVSAPA